MRRAAPVALAALSLAGCARRPAAPLVPLGASTPIRVGIVVDRDSATLSATGQFWVLGPDEAVLAAVDSGRPWIVRAGDAAGGLSLERPDRGQSLVVGGPVTVRPVRDQDLVLIDGRRYRGTAVARRGTAGVTVVNRLPLEYYLLSVVALELGFRAPSDRAAVMAQAVAARTDAVRWHGRREALGFDVFATDADQVYGGADVELPEVADAVHRTWGQILTYRGTPIEALFHSTCGWSTEAAEQVFQNHEPVPYLRAVSDRYGDGDNDYYCSISPRFRWRQEWDAETLATILARTLPAALGSRAPAVGRLTDLRISRTTPTGRVAELVVTTTSGEFTVPAGRIREVLRPGADRQLLSSLFQLYLERREGTVVRVVAAGAGYGHGVGMCQFGAVGRSRAGHDYRAILATYYQDTRLERAY